MRLRRVEIERFRGIKKLHWNVVGDFVCLLGPGDSTKTTILDAIELTLSPRWNVSFNDADFYDANTEHPLSITITVCELHDEPEEGSAMTTMRTVNKVADNFLKGDS